MDSILQLLHKLQIEQVEFVLIGGMAASLHGSAVITLDLDICLSFTKENNIKLVKALKDVDPRFRMTPNRKPLPLDATELERFKNLYLSTTAGQLDILSEVDGIGDYTEVQKQSEQHVINGLPIQMLTIDAIIHSKSVLRRDKDRYAIIELTRLKQKLRDE